MKTYDFERRPGEGDKAFFALQAYLRLGATRTLGAVVRQHHLQSQSVGRWFRDFDWAARAAAYDTRMALVAQEVEDAAMRERGPVWVQRTEHLREKSWQTYGQVIKLAESCLEAFMRRKPKRAVSVSDIARLLEIATKLGCLATGYAADRVSVVGDDGGPVKVELLAALDRAYGEAPGLKAPAVDVEVVVSPGADAGGAKSE
jgi:hypothetical protein